MASETGANQGPKKPRFWRDCNRGIRQRHIVFVLLFLAIFAMFAATVFPLTLEKSSCNDCDDWANSTSPAMNRTTDWGVPVPDIATDTVLPPTESIIVMARAHQTPPALSTTIVISGSTVIVTLPGSVFISPFTSTSGTSTLPSTEPTEVPHTTPHGSQKVTTTADNTDTKATHTTDTKATHTTGNTGNVTMITGSDGSAPTTWSSGQSFESTTTMDLTMTVNGTETGGLPTETTTSSGATMSDMKVTWVKLLTAMVVALAVTGL